ncbi:MAG: CPBP family intramembrane glutamic endopeptidase [Planctomycetota bacterium]
MSNESTSPRPSTIIGRVAALAEVVAAFGVVHVAYRTFKEFTFPGQWERAQHLNYSPGLFMIVGALFLVLASRRPQLEFGLASAPRGSLALGLTFGLLAAIGAGAIVWFGHFHIEPGKPPPDGLALLGAIGEVFLAGVLLLSVRHGLGLYKRLPAPMCLAAFTLACLVPILLALRSDKPIGGAAALVGELLLCAGLGEELFFRGYMQSRLNMAFGRPYRVLGTQFGVGLLVTSVMFGFIHALNTVDYFNGRYEFAWAWGLMNVGAGLLFGLMRERTGSILPGAVAHAVTDILERAPAFL